jgi:hypothetical protein
LPELWSVHFAGSGHGARLHGALVEAEGPLRGNAGPPGKS